jgi:glutaredoxin 3
MTKKIEIYTKFTCPFCSRAKQLLTSKGAEYTEYDVTMDSAKRDEMTARVPGARTVPQILFAGEAIGGYDDLSALDRAGKLDAMLAKLHS